ncbi:MAG TPA: ferredoxin--NADP reductase [Pseudomonadota bacterium]|nr:ferredoxin--NADP reductase [Pseudomonadota bacterium]
MIDLFRMPRFLRERWDMTKRDVGMLALFLSGHHPPPLVPLNTVPAQHALVTPRALRVLEVRRETADALTLVLHDPAGLPIPCLPGQFFTILVAQNGKLLRRAYSASHYVEDAMQLHLTCKRIAGGQVSTHLHEYAHPGMMLQVLGPSGQFAITPKPDCKRRIVLLGGGSGITPLHCMLTAVLAVEKESSVALLFGNQRKQEIIFLDHLQELAAQHPKRFTLRHVLAEPDASLDAVPGILDQSTISAILGSLPQDDGTVQYYLCGPQGMMDAARATLLQNGVSPSRIHEEKFATPQLASRSLSSAPQVVELTHKGRSQTVQVEPEETILEAGLRSGIDLPFSCTMGGCGACKGKLVDGDVDLPEPNCLTPKEREDRQVLLCVAHPAKRCRIEVP